MNGVIWIKCNVYILRISSEFKSFAYKKFLSIEILIMRKKFIWNENKCQWDWNIKWAYMKIRVWMIDFEGIDIFYWSK